ncbi:MAG: asparagine synthetase [Sedimenticola sp.]
MKRTPLAISFLILLGLALSGCKSLGMITQSDPEKTLRTALRSYEATLRWGYIGQAYNFLEPELQAKSKIPDNLDNIRVTHYNILQAPVMTGEGDERTAKQVAVILYVFQDRQIEKKLVDRQQWRYIPDEKTWVRINHIPDFK